MRNEHQSQATSKHGQRKMNALDAMGALGRLRLMGSLGLSASVTLILFLSSRTAETRLGVPLYWPWLLTGLQVLAIWAAGAKHWWGWLLGASVQPPWIAYAVLTGQLGFIPGCAISTAVQTYSFLRGKYTPRGGLQLLPGSGNGAGSVAVPPVSHDR